MPRSVLDETRFRNEQAAYAYVESIIWAHGRVCPKCGVVDQSGALKGKSTRVGLYKCYACRKPFTVKIGTIFEKSHVPMHIWLQAMHLMCSSKKGFSSLQFCRVLGVDFKTGWSMGHRIREAMRDTGGFADPMGGAGRTVEIDQAYIGGLDENRHANKRVGRRGRGGKATVFALVERGASVRAFHIPTVTGANLGDILGKNVSRNTTIYSDSGYPERQAASRYRSAAIDHTLGEYVRGDVHTNTVEGYFATVKRAALLASITVSAKPICSAISTNSASAIPTEKHLA
jgi:transposase-like protein